MDSKKILVLGSLNIDIVVTVDNMPLEGETILGRNVSYFPGGKGANQACAVAKLGGDVTMIGRVGMDQFGDTLIEELKNVGVDTRYIQKQSESSTGMAIVCVNKRGNNSIVVVPGANDACNKEYVQSLYDVIRETDIIILQMEIAQDGIYDAIRFAKQENKTIIFNPAPASKAILGEAINGIDYILPNESELHILTELDVDSEEDIVRAAQKLLTQGVKNVIVTLGDKGALHVTTENVKFYIAPKVAAIDTTAAGDTFNGAFAVFLAEGNTVEDAIKFAITAASISVTRHGAQPSIPLREEVRI